MNCRSANAGRTTPMRVPNQVKIKMFLNDLDNMLNFDLSRASDPTSVVIDRLTLTLALREQIAKGDVDETIGHLKTQGWLCVGTNDTFQLSQQGARELKK